jgi:hypothetical protein
MPGKEPARSIPGPPPPGFRRDPAPMIPGPSSIGYRQPVSHLLPIGTVCHTLMPME